MDSHIYLEKSTLILSAPRILLWLLFSHAGDEQFGPAEGRAKQRKSGVSFYLNCTCAFVGRHLSWTRVVRLANSPGHASRRQLNLSQELPLWADSEHLSSAMTSHPQTAFFVLTMTIWHAAIDSKERPALVGRHLAFFRVVRVRVNAARRRVGKIHRLIVATPRCAVWNSQSFEHAV